MEPTPGFRRACQDTSDDELAAQFVASIISGVPGAIPEQDDYDLGRKLLRAIEEEVQKDVSNSDGAVLRVIFAPSDKKLSIIKAIRWLTNGSLKATRDLVEMRQPIYCVDSAEAHRLAQELLELGCTIEWGDGS